MKCWIAKEILCPRKEDAPASDNCCAIVTKPPNQNNVSHCEMLVAIRVGLEYHYQLTALVLLETSFHVIVPICNKATMPSNATKVESKCVIVDVTHKPRHPNKTTHNCYAFTSKLTKC